MTSSLWFYSKDEAAYFNGDIEESFNYKTKLIVSTTAANGVLENTTIAD